MLRSLLLAALLSGGICRAHQDKIIAIGADGTLVGLPSEFTPARLQIAFVPPGSERRAPISWIQLTLGKQSTRLPFCLTALLKTEVLSDVEASASWYHDERSLPYYLNLKFYDPGRRGEPDFDSGFSLLFNLRTARLMQMNVNVARKQRNQAQMLPLDLAALCPPAELVQFKDAARAR